MQMKNQKAITLIALIVTIIILLILAGIAILSITGEKGLFNYAKRARQDTINEQEAENKTLKNYETLINQTSTDEVFENKTDNTGNAGEIEENIQTAIRENSSKLYSRKYDMGNIFCR